MFRIVLLRLSLALVCLVGSLLSPSGVAFAEPAHDGNIAVVDMQKLLSDSLAARSIQKQSQLARDGFVEQLSAQEGALRESEKKLTEQAQSLPKDEFLKEKQGFEQKFQETQTMAKEQKKALESGYSAGMNTLMQAIYEVVQSVADEKGYSLVLTKQSIVVGHESFDITQACMERLNAKIPDVRLDISAAVQGEKKK